MQSLFSLFAKSSSTRTARAEPATQAGPQELDVQQLQQVSGGLPKGGWVEPSASMGGESLLPKGGW